MLRDVLAGLDPPIVHQRRFAATLDELIDAGRSPALATPTGPLAVLEVARMEVVLHAARVALWRDLLAAAPSAVPDLARPPAELLAARRLVGGAGAARALTAGVATARTGLFRARQAARRLAAERRAAPPPVTEAEVVVVPWRAVHLGRWRPVLEALAAQEGWRTLVVAADPRVLAAAREAGLAGRRLTWGPGDPRADTAVRWDLARLARTVGGPLGAALRAVPGPTLGPARAVAAALAGAASARLVVVANPYIAEGRAAALSARSVGLPVTSSQHGTVFPADPRWERLPVDRLCLWDASARDTLAGAGIPPDRLVVTGRVTPAPAGSTGREAEPSREVAGPGADESRKTVLVATSGPGDRVSLAQHLVFLDHLREAVTRTPDRSWVVKLHVKDDPRHYAALAAAGVEVVPAGPATPPIEAFLARAAVLVTVASATALDAARQGVPVVLVAVPGSDDHELVAAMAGTDPPVAHDGAQLAALVTTPTDRRPAAPPGPPGDPTPGAAAGRPAGSGEVPTTGGGPERPAAAPGPSDRAAPGAPGDPTPAAAALAATVAALREVAREP